MVKFKEFEFEYERSSGFEVNYVLPEKFINTLIGEIGRQIGHPIGQGVGQGSAFGLLYRGRYVEQYLDCYERALIGDLENYSKNKIKEKREEDSKLSGRLAYQAIDDILKSHKFFWLPTFRLQFNQEEENFDITRRFRKSFIYGNTNCGLYIDTRDDDLLPICLKIGERYEKLTSGREFNFSEETRKSATIVYVKTVWK